MDDGAIDEAISRYPYTVARPGRLYRGATDPRDR